jgi:hypothetical protein
MLKKKIWANFSKNYRTFCPKIVTKLSKIWIWDPGSRGQKGTGSRIRIRNTESWRKIGTVANVLFVLGNDDSLVSARLYLDLFKKTILLAKEKRKEDNML